MDRPGVAPHGEGVPAPDTDSTTATRKVRHTFHLSADVLEAARDATDFLSGPPERMTLSRLVEDALVVALTRLRETHNEGERFPPRGADLRGGRPISRKAP